MDGEKIHEVAFEAEAVSSGRMRNDVTVSWPQMKETYDFATDEGPALGGDGTAPPPLAFFLTALVGCLMTNIRMMARAHKVEIDEVRVSGRATWLRRVRGAGPHVADTEGFHMDVEIDTEADDDAVAELIAAARAGCFVEHSLINPARITHRLRRDRGWIDV